jgi:hypothetical protein
MERVGWVRGIGAWTHCFCVTYLITFSCYGSHLHGDERGSVDPEHNGVGWPARDAEPALVRFEKREMRQAPYLLDHRRREIVLVAIRGVCAFRGWTLFAAHVRMNHAHVVADLNGTPDAAARDFKAYSSRALNDAGVDRPGKIRWTRHFSGRWLRDEDARAGAIRYVAAQQGEPMSLYVREDPAVELGKKLPERSV